MAPGGASASVAGSTVHSRNTALLLVTVETLNVYVRLCKGKTAQLNCGKRLVLLELLAAEVRGPLGPTVKEVAVNWWRKGSSLRCGSQVSH